MIEPMSRLLNKSTPWEWSRIKSVILSLLT